MKKSEWNVIVPKEFIENKFMNLEEKMLYITLCSFMRGNNNCFPSKKTLADMCECSTFTINRILNSLWDKGFVTWSKEITHHISYKENNIYIIHTYVDPGNIFEMHNRASKTIRKQRLENSTHKGIKIKEGIRLRNKYTGNNKKAVYLFNDKIV